MVDVVDGHTGILDHLVEGGLGAIQQVLSDALEFCAGEGFIQEQRVLVCINRDVREVDVGGLRRGQLNLCLLSCLAQTLHGHLVLGQVNAVGRLKLVYQPFDDALIPVVTTELVVTGGGTDFHHTVADFQQGDVKGTATKVEDQDGLLLVTLF